MNLRRWLLLPLINTALALIICIGHAGATLLKDVRIGEYDKFTRVVFEFDSPINTRKIEALEAGRLKIAFPDTSPDLIRKIPVERSDRLRRVHIWVGKTDLSAVLTFTFDHFRFESFQLSNPPRIALDVYRLGQLAAMPAESGPIKGSAGTQKGHPEDALENAPGPEPAPLSNHSGPDFNPALQRNLSSEDVSGSGPPTIATTSNALSPDYSTPQPSSLPNDPQTHSGTLDQTEAASQTAPESSSLPYYLVVSLVVITIIILILLLLMLFSRQRWLDDSKPISIDEFLQRQDERIASLDERIQEQLKRYDDA